MSAERLQKVLARAGIASRRKCEELIAEGHVTVDGEVMTEMGLKVDPAVQDIRFNGQRIKAEAMLYYMVNKPRGVVCSEAPQAGERRVTDIVPVRERIFTIGRLDKDSEGLIILTNDGAFANRIAHPRYEVPKTYIADVQGDLDERTLRRLRGGIILDGEKAKPLKVFVVQQSPTQSRLEISLNEGRNREVRRMLLALGFPVKRLRRTQIGDLRLGALKPGKFRDLTDAECRKLLTPVGEIQKRHRRLSGKRPPRPKGRT